MEVVDWVARGGGGGVVRKKWTVKSAERSGSEW